MDPLPPGKVSPAGADWAKSSSLALPKKVEISSLFVGCFFVDISSRFSIDSWKGELLCVVEDMGRPRGARVGALGRKVVLTRCLACSVVDGTVKTSTISNFCSGSFLLSPAKLPQDVKSTSLPAGSKLSILEGKDQDHNLVTIWTNSYLVSSISVGMVGLLILRGVVDTTLRLFIV